MSTEHLPSDAAYHRHLRRNEPACVGCKGEHVKAAREHREVRRERERLAHGTPDGLALHLERGDVVCDACLDAECDRELGAARAFRAGLAVRQAAQLQGWLDLIRRHRRLGAA